MEMRVIVFCLANILLLFLMSSLRRLFFPLVIHIDQTEVAQSRISVSAHTANQSCRISWVTVWLVKAASLCRLRRRQLQMHMHALQRFHSQLKGASTSLRLYLHTGNQDSKKWKVLFCSSPDSGCASQCLIYITLFCVNEQTFSQWWMTLQALISFCKKMTNYLNFMSLAVEKGNSAGFS